MWMAEALIRTHMRSLRLNGAGGRRVERHSSAACHNTGPSPRAAARAAAGRVTRAVACARVGRVNYEKAKVWLGDPPSALALAGGCRRYTPNSFQYASRAPDDLRLSRPEFFCRIKNLDPKKSFSFAYGDHQDVTWVRCIGGMPKISRKFHVPEVARHMENRRPSRLMAIATQRKFTPQLRPHQHGAHVCCLAACLRTPQL